MRHMFATSFSERQIKRMLAFLLLGTALLYPLDWLSIDHHLVAMTLALALLTIWLLFSLRIMWINFFDATKTDSEMMHWPEARVWRRQHRPDYRNVLAMLFLLLVWLSLGAAGAPDPVSIAALALGGFYFALFTLARVSRNSTDPRA